MVGEDNDKFTKMHNCRFYRPEPRAAHCMALHIEDKKLAISRNDGSIEIWNLAHTPFIERSIPQLRHYRNIEALTWLDRRLFAVGLHGFLLEYDLKLLKEKRTTALTGADAYCIDSDPHEKKLAIGTKNGYLNIFSATDDELVFEKFCDKQEGQILCLKYDPSGRFIASGGIDAIRVWDVSTGQAIHRMTTGRSEANKMTLVWSIAFTEDLIVISGDSRGKLTFWDSKVGSQLESYQSHRADILALSLSEDGENLYCAGTDPNIMSYVRVNIKGGTHKWVKSIQRKVHDHDVRALAVLDNKLYSSGIDGYLACSYHPPKTLLKYPPIMQNCAMLAPQTRCLLVRYPTSLDIWHLGKEAVEQSGNSVLVLDKKPERLISVYKTPSKKNTYRESFLCSAISATAELIFYSTLEKPRILWFNVHKYLEDGSLEMRAKHIHGRNPGPCVNAVFPNDSSLVLAPQKGGLIFYTKIQIGFRPVDILNCSGVLTDTVTFLVASKCGKFVVAADPKSNIVVFKQNDDNSWKCHCKLPRYNSGVTAINIQPGYLNLVVAYSDHKIVEYDLKKLKFTKFSRNLDMLNVKKWVSKNYPIKNISFDPRFPDRILMHDDTNLVTIDKMKKLPEPDEKIPKIDSSLLNTDSNDALNFKTDETAFRAIKKYKHLVFFGHLDDNEFVAVEVNPLVLTEGLPPCLDQNTFGTK